MFVTSIKNNDSKIKNYTLSWLNWYVYDDLSSDEAKIQIMMSESRGKGT